MNNIKNLDLISKELFTAIRNIFKNNIYTTKAIKISLKANKGWDETKKGFFSETVYDITRYWRLLWYLTKKEPSFKYKDFEQILNAYLFYKGEKVKTSGEIKNRLSSANKIRAIRESVPDWLDELCLKELGKKWNNVLKALNKKPELIIRVNTLKKTRDELINILKNEGLQAEKMNYSPDALIIKERKNIFRLKSFKEGFFEVQDAASQMVSQFLDPKPGMLVVDACAGEGSKTLHLAALMKNRGRIIVMDIQEWKLIVLKKRANRVGAFNIETRPLTSSKAYKRLKGKVDKILIDVPCSGLGTLRRNPDIKWKLTLFDIDRLKKLQSELLNRYCNLLKIGGQAVYSTCSILPSEGEEQIRAFLEKQDSNFNLIKEKRLWPDVDNTDGFYMALIEKK